MILMEALSVVAALLVLCGAGFSFLAAVGLLRLPDLYTRLHAASKAGVVGAGLVLLGVAVIAGDGPVVFRALAGIFFLVLTTPISAHLLARAAYLAGLKPDPSTHTDEMALHPDNRD